MKKTVLIALTLSLALYATSVFAGVKEGQFSLSPMVSGYTFEGKQHLETAPAYGIRGGYNITKRFAVEALFDYIDTKSTIGAGDLRLYRYGGEAIYNMFPDNRLVPFLAIGYGRFGADGSVPSSVKPKNFFDYGAGVKYFITDAMALRADVRHIVASTTNIAHKKNVHNIEYGMGVLIPFGGTAPAPKPVAPPVQEASQPKAAPAQPVVVATPDPDTDGDGIVDRLDKCPGTPAGVKVDANGCPLDTDGDGVYDYLDKCADTPKGVKVDANGCPLDTDGDGVYDYLDKCPDTPSGVTVDKNGCPPPVEKGSGLKLSGGKLKLTLNVQFDTGKSDVKSQYSDELKNVGMFLNENKNVKGVIEGHTDNVGGKAMNQTLSKRRADSVREYIVKNFSVDRTRLSAKGYGQTKPVADNATAEGRQKNRRIDAYFEEIPDFKPDADEPAKAKPKAKKAAAKPKGKKQ